MHAFHMKCSNVAFSVVPRKGDGDAENWNRVWVRYGLLVWHTFYTVCFFFFFFVSLGFTFNTLRDLLKRIVLKTSCLSVRSSVRLIRGFAVCMKKPWVLSYPLSAQQRLSGCPGWSESSLGAQVVLFVLSCCGSFIIFWFVWNSSRKQWYSCIHARVYLSPLIMSYCRWVVVLTFFLHTRPGFPWTRPELGNVVLHEGCKTTLVHDVSMTILTSFSRQFPPNVSTST